MPVLRRALTIYCLIFVVLSQKQLYFGKIMKCVDVGPANCHKWNTTIALSIQLDFYYYMCFPATTRVLTEEGPVPLEDLQQGDRILGYNFETGKPEYSEVEAWLHRDTISKAEFTQLRTNNSHTFVSSAGHNIGFNDAGNIGFKYADEFQVGDELLTLTSEHKEEAITDMKVVQARGLYSPYTALSNFYILPQEEGSSSMVLVHCLAQVADPHSKEGWMHTAMSISGILGLNAHQNQVDEQYLHPVTHLMGWTGPEHRTVKTVYAVHSDDPTHNQQFIENAVNSHNNREQERKKMLGWFSLFQITFNEIFLK